MLCFALLLVILSQVHSSCSSNCLLCDSISSICYACTSPMSPFVGGACKNASVFDGCLIYGSDSMCSRCKLSYRLNNGKCINDKSGCLRFSDNLSCLECGFGMTLIGGTCTGILNCLNYTDSNNQTCVQCFSGFNIVNNTCFADLGCQNVTSNGICSLCSTGYQLSGFGCVQATLNISGCAIYSIAGQCLYCETYLVKTTPIQCSTPQLNSTHITVSPAQNGSASAGLQMIIPDNNISSSQNIVYQSSSEQNCQAYDSLGICFSCNYGFYLKGTVCVEASKTCDGYNIINGQCIACISGYSLTPKGECLLGKKVDPNCNIASNSTCIACKYGYYLADNVCEQVSALCVGYNLLNGDCLGCPTNYVLSNGVCNPVSTPKPSTGVCSKTDPQNNTRCLKCIDGYHLTVDSLCVATTSDPNCKTFVLDQCKACSNGYYLNSQFACSQVDPLCATYDSNNGFCLTCYSGYTIQGSTCINSNSGTVQQQPQSISAVTPLTSTSTILIPSTPSTPSTPLTSSTAMTMTFDPNCASNSPTGQCLKCAGGYYKSAQKCVQVSAQCKTSNQDNGNCLSCYDGYTLQSGDCIDTSLIDSKCLTYTNGSCSQCIAVYYLVNNKCSAVSITCETFDSVTGVCTGCRQNFKVSLIDAHYCIDKNCATYENDTCINCLSPYYLVNNTCNIIIIIPSTSDTLKDPNCASNNNGICSGCVEGYYIQNNVCVQVSPLCATNDNITGSCLSCYSTFVLVAGNCIKADQTLSNNIIIVKPPPNCKTIENNICIECSQGYWLNSSLCQIVNVQCKTYDSLTGNCTSCYSGYTPSSPGYCLINSIQNSNCKTLSGSICTQCNSGYVLSMGKCTLVMSLCATIDSVTGQCTSCYPGYYLNGTDCKLQDINCKNYSGMTCLQCKQGFFLSNNTCIQVSPLCQSFDNQSGNCTSCYQGYTLSSGKCEISKVDNICKTQQDNGLCTECITGYVLNNGICNNTTNQVKGGQ